MFFNTKKFAKMRLMATYGGVFRENIYFYILILARNYEL